ncbi:MAG: PQQ-dependent sugar dehydrogenase, partial [Verrucomicrobiae bacterium]|nr:PQQ-dependent sugar dehydrogenase [Verrucomicrobiae bacterium]
MRSLCVVSRLLAVMVFLVCPLARAAFPEVALIPVSEGELVAPVEIVHAGDGSGRLFIADQRGKIQILLPSNGTVLATPFLDLGTSLVTQRSGYDERGLLGMAFHPDYANSGADGEGKFYVYYSAPSPNEPGTVADPVDHRSVVAEFNVSTVDPNVAIVESGRILLTFDQPQFNHDGGDLAFGPDGLLYISTGDGGSSDDNNAGHTGGDGSKPAGVLGNAQDRTKLLGKILRIDPLGTNGPGGQYGIPASNPFVGAGGGVREEIYAYGFRNPWRISFDPVTGRLFVADVGQGKVEEIDLVESGANYGWRNREGTFDFDPTAPGTGPFVDPIAQYAHPGVTIGSPALPQIGLSVTGGEVYRGGNVPALYGKYIFADWSTSFGAPNGTLLGLEETSPGQFAMSQLTVTGGNPIARYITALGSDENGELYIATRTVLPPQTHPTSGLPTGGIYRLGLPATPVQVTLEANRDNTIYSERATNSNAKGAYLFTGNIAQGGERRALVRFNLSPIPAGAQIQSASVKLTLDLSNSPNVPFQWHRLTADWGEGTSNAGEPGGQGTDATVGDATWSRRFYNTQSWTTPGGDFVGTASASATISGVTTWTSAQLAQDVQDWVDGTASNFGWILRDPGTDVSAKRFFSREAPTFNDRPKLVVSYVSETPPAPAALNLTSATDSGTSDSDDVTNDPTPDIEAVAPLGTTLKLFADGVEVGSAVVTTIPCLITVSTLSDGIRSITATATDSQGGTSPASDPLLITIDTQGPAAGVPDLLAGSDSGASDHDEITNVTTPDFQVSGEAGATVSLSSDVTGALGTGLVGAPVTAVAMSEGSHQVTAVLTDAAGNNGAVSSPLIVTIDVTAPGAPTGLDLLASSDDGASDSDNQTTIRTPTISGDADSGTTVSLISDLDGAVGSAAGGPGFEITTSQLSLGMHQLTGTAEDVAGNTSSPSSALSLDIIEELDPRDLKPVGNPMSPFGALTANDAVWADAAAGVFDGLLIDQSDGTSLMGAVSKLVVTKPSSGSPLGGAVTGVVRMNGRSALIHGRFDADGRLLLTLPQRDGSTVEVDLQLKETDDMGGDQRRFVIGGTIDWNGATALVSLARAAYHFK